MRTLVVALVLLAGCKDKEQSDKARDVVAQAKDKTAEMAGGAKDKLGEMAGKAVDTAGEAADKAGDTAGKAADKAGEAVDKVGEAYDKALVLGRGAKAELDKVYKTDKDYALAVDDVASEDAGKHAERLDKMPSIEIKGVRVGYEEDSNLSLRGTTYSKHFRASWKRGDGKLVRVSFYTKEQLDLVAFAQLLQKLVPAVQTVLR